MIGLGKPMGRGLGKDMKAMAVDDPSVDEITCAAT